MKLEKYLKEINNCQDELINYNWNFLNQKHTENVQRLRYDFGVYDNYRILVKGKFNEFSKDLGKIGFLPYFKQTFDASQLGKRGAIIKDFKPKYGISLRLRNDLWTNDFEKDMKKQSENFDFTITLHTNNHLDRSLGYSCLKDMTRVICEIGNYAIENKISVCLPNSVGLKEPKDYSKIIYYLPKKRGKK